MQQILSNQRLPLSRLLTVKSRINVIFILVQFVLRWTATLILTMNVTDMMLELTAMVDPTLFFKILLSNMLTVPPTPPPSTPTLVLTWQRRRGRRRV